jgi:hypothetical protein
VYAGVCEGRPAPEKTTKVNKRKEKRDARKGNSKQNEGKKEGEKLKSKKRAEQTDQPYCRGKDVHFSHLPGMFHFGEGMDMCVVKTNGLRRNLPHRSQGPSNQPSNDGRGAQLDLFEPPMS